MDEIEANREAARVRPTDLRGRFLAAIWFGVFALLSVEVMFHPLGMAGKTTLLYILLPTLAGVIAGGLCGASIVNSAKTGTVGKAFLRGIAVSAIAYVIFSLLFAVTLPFIEKGWSGQPGGLFVLTLTYGILLACPIILFGGMLAGATLYWFGKAVSG